MSKPLNFGIRNKLLPFIILMVLLISTSAFAEEFPAATANDFKVSEIFSDNMVLQQNEDIVIWGTSSHEGGVIHAKLGDSYGYSYVTDGKWQITLAPRAGGLEKFTLEIYGSGAAEYTTYKDITIGDVWMLIGQSNVEFKFGNIEQYNNLVSDLSGSENVSVFYVNSADYAEIDENAEFSGMPLRGTRAWQNISHPMNVNASAIGMCVGMELNKLSGNGLPIGILSMGFAGKELENFVQPELAERLSGFGGESLIYKNYLEPTAPLKVRGVIWYQGETNASYWAEYTDALVEFVQNYRELKNQNFPFYIVELPPCYRAPDEENHPDWQYINFGGVRAEMGKVPMKLDNCYICPTSDLWSDRTYVNNLHPMNKYEISQRLSKMIASNEWEFEGYELLNAPVIKSVNVSDDHLVHCEIVFDNAGEGLKWNGEEGKGFALIGKDWNLIPYTIEIKAPNILVIDAEAKIYDIRYGWDTTCEFGRDVTLCNSGGIPAAAFSYNLCERPVALSAKLNILIVKVAGFVYENIAVLVTAFAICVAAVVWVIYKKRRNGGKK